MTASSNDPGFASKDSNARLAKTLTAVLRPLVRLTLHRQFTYPQLAALLKGIFVDVAEEEFRVGQKRQSDSRIHLLTGVHRKDVKRLRAATTEEDSSPATIAAGPQLVAQWLGDPDYVDADGLPLAIPFKASDEETPAFENLVKRVVKQDIRARVILDEWLRLGVADFDGETVTLHSGAFTPEKGFEEKAYFFAKNIQDHIAASGNNLLGGEPFFFDRSVYYDGLTEESLAELNQMANELGMQALTTMNKAAMARQQADAGSSSANHRLNFGVFAFDSVARDLPSRSTKHDNG